MSLDQMLFHVGGKTTAGFANCKVFKTILIQSKKWHESFALENNHLFPSISML